MLKDACCALLDLLTGAAAVACVAQPPVTHSQQPNHDAEAHCDGVQAKKALPSFQRAIPQAQKAVQKALPAQVKKAIPQVKKAAPKPPPQVKKAPVAAKKAFTQVRLMETHICILLPAKSPAPQTSFFDLQSFSPLG